MRQSRTAASRVKGRRMLAAHCCVESGNPPGGGNQSISPFLRQ